MNKLIKTIAFALSIGWVSTAVTAQDMPMPQGEVVLTITGDIAVTNADGALVFDRDMLAALGTESFETTTIWTDGTQKFEGVLLKTLTDLLGLDDGTLMAVAINDYSVEIPVAEVTANGPIVAHLMNGEEMSVREKGPLWIVYPFDSNSEYRAESIYARSIWQLDTIRVVN